MGWKGTLRAINASAKRASREADKRHRANLKAQEANDAADAVYEWQSHLYDLVSLHKVALERIDWHQIANQRPPAKPELDASKTIKAKHKLESFKPSFYHRLFGRSERTVEKLQAALDRSVDRDRAAHLVKAEKFQADFDEWETDVSIARNLVTGDPQAQREAVAESQTLSNEQLIGTSIGFEFSDGLPHALPVVHDIEIVPDFRRKQLSSGRLSESNMPKSERMDIYQDYVSSVALRVAGELFAILPAEQVRVTCHANMLNTSTGYKEETPILSVEVVRPTYDSLNLENIDPSDALLNFNHDMKFKRSSGFSRI